MKVVLVNPPLSVAEEVSPPVGLCTLTAWLIECGHEVSLFDLELETKGQAPGVRADYLDLFTTEMRVRQPDVVGVTSMYNNSLQAERLIGRAKAVDPTVVTVAGGSHFGALCERSLDRIADLDYAVEGEGELGFAELLDAVSGRTALERVPGLWFRRAGAPRAAGPGALIDLARIPPLWEAIAGSVPLDRYVRTIPAGESRRAVYVEAGRGCPFHCTFCATAPFWRRRYRVKPPEVIVAEIRYLHRQLGYDSFMLVHDLPTANRQFVSDLADALLAARLPVEWMINHRTDLSLEGLLPKLRAAGCWKVFMGVETASDRQQAIISKGLTLTGTTNTVRVLADQAIAATCSFVFGFPDETLAELSATIGLGAKLRLLGAETVQYHRLRLWPPAPLAGAGLDADFDPASLRIEYPFDEVPAADAAAIADDPEFFAGYFAPHSRAGSFDQLAQVELFFGQAVTLAPLTLAALARLLGPDLVRAFFEALARHGPIARGRLDGGRFDLVDNWLVVRPLLEALTAYGGLAPWERALSSALLRYEHRRLRFAWSREQEPDADLVADEIGWLAFRAAVDVPSVIDAVRSDADLVRELGCEHLYLFAHAAGGDQAYRLDLRLESRVRACDAEIVTAFATG